MAGRRPPSDLGSQWVTVPRQFRGIKSTSLPTELAYVTPEEIGLLRQADIHRSGLANKSQGGPGGVLSLDDSGGMYLGRTKDNWNTWTPEPAKPQPARGTRKVDPAKSYLTAGTPDWKPKKVERPAYMDDKPGPASVYVGGEKPKTLDFGFGGGGKPKNGDKNGVDTSGSKKSGGVGLGGWAGTGMTREEYVRNIGTGAGDDPPPRNGDDPPPPTRDFDFTKITDIIGGTEGLYGGDSGSLWNSRGNYHETDPGKGNYTTAAGGRKGLGDPRADYGGPGFLYWHENSDRAAAYYAGLTDAEKRREDLQANVEANRPSNTKSFGEFKTGGGKGWQSYIDYLNEAEVQEGGQGTGQKKVNTDNKGGYNPTNIGGFNFTEGYADMVMPVFEMTDDMSIRAQLPKMINTNTALFKAASTKILQDFQKRGIANSSMASGAALQTIVNLSMDILKEDTQRLFQAGQINHEMARERFLKQMQYATEIILRQLTEGGAMSRALLTEQGAGYRSRLTGLVSMMSGEDADPAKWAEYLRLVGGAK